MSGVTTFCYAAVMHMLYIQVNSRDEGRWAQYAPLRVASRLSDKSCKLGQFDEMQDRLEKSAHNY